jgi:hypothetical protein
MKIVVLPSARDDLSDGFDFYERQREGLGDYFLESLSSGIDSLQLYAGIHLKVFHFHRLLSNDFLTRLIMISKTKPFAFGPCSIAGKDPATIRRRLNRL